MNNYDTRTPAVPCNLSANDFPLPFKGFHSIPGRLSVVSESKLRRITVATLPASPEITPPETVLNPASTNPAAIGMANIIKDQ